MLKAQAARQLDEQPSWQEGWTDTGYVFTRKDGRAAHPEVGERAASVQAVRKAKLPAIRLHDLRHTHATLALQAGVHPKVVSERLGHATVSITLDTYSHAIPAMQEEAAGRLRGWCSALTCPLRHAQPDASRAATRGRDRCTIWLPYGQVRG